VREFICRGDELVGVKLDRSASTARRPTFSVSPTSRRRLSCAFWSLVLHLKEAPAVDRAGHGGGDGAPIHFSTSLGHGAANSFDKPVNRRIACR
jgi:hypothetical protein